MEMWKIEKQKAKEKLPNKDWLKNAKEVAVSKRKRGYEKLQSFPLGEILEKIPNGFSEEDPKIFEVEFLDAQPREVETRRGDKTKVIDILVHRSELPDIVKEDTEYLLWWTTVIEKQYNEVKPVTGQKYILAYHGKYMKGKKPSTTDPHIVNIIPQ